MISFLPCGCQLEVGTNKFVAYCEACRLAMEKQKADAAAVKKLTVEDRLVALEKRVWG